MFEFNAPGKHVDVRVCCEIEINLPDISKRDERWSWYQKMRIRVSHPASQAHEARLSTGPSAIDIDIVSGMLMRMAEHVCPEFIACDTGHKDELQTSESNRTSLPYESCLSPSSSAPSNPAQTCTV